MATIRQTNFLGGELNPELWGRTDLPVYARAARTLRNFFVTKSGAAKTRPGSMLVREARPSPPLAVEDLEVRLLPFIAGDEVYQSYVLEFGYGYIRFHTLGGTVESAPGVPLEVTLDVDGIPPPWGSTSVPLATLKYAQVGDVMTLVAPGMYPMELKRLGHGSWRLSRINFDRYQPAFKDVGRGPYPNLFDPTGQSLIWPVLWTPMLVNDWFAGDADHPAREWVWAVTAVVKDRETGVTYETKPRIVTQDFDGKNYYPGGGVRDDDSPASADGPIGVNASVDALPHNRVAVFLDKPATIKFGWYPAAVAPAGANSYNVVAFNYYRGRGGIFGWVGQSNRGVFVDVGQEPDYTLQPPLGTDPFRILLPARASDQHPFSVAFFEERRWFGGAADPLAKDPAAIPADVSTSRPSTLFASETGDYYAFDRRQIIHVDGESLLFDLATTKREEIRHLVPRERLLVFTNGAVRSVGGGPDSPIDHDSIQARVEEEIGATHVVPVTVEGAVLYVRAKGNGARALLPNGDRYRGADVSEHAHHLLLGSSRTIVDWAFQEDPYGVVWAVRADGELLSLTFNGESAAWAHHDTDGHYESVCAVPEGDEDAVYVTVVRHDGDGTPRRLIERFTSRVRRGGASSDAFGALEQSADDICLDSALEYFDDAAETFTGLEHLEGKKVYALVPTDTGMELYGPFTVDAGQIAFPDGEGPPANLQTALGPKLLLYVGLVFEADFETLDVSGDARLRKKTVARAGFEVDNSRGLLIGQDLEHLDEWIQREEDDDFNAISPDTTVVDVPVESSVDLSARLVLRVAQPFPVTIVGVVRKVVLDED